MAESAHITSHSSQEVIHDRSAKAFVNGQCDWYVRLCHNGTRHNSYMQQPFPSMLSNINIFTVDMQSNEKTL